MDVGKRFLILSLGGEKYALAISKLLEITIPRGIYKKDAELPEIFEGKLEYRGQWIPALDIKKVFKIAGNAGANLLVVKTIKGVLGVLVDDVMEILDTDLNPAPMPQGVINPGLRYYRGVLRYKEELVLLLNEDGLLP
jgi:chemotaxis signal transduction protein